MGCASSTEVNQVTGKEKKKLGGAYPGNRRPQQAPYQPPQSEFQKVDGNTAQATAHFVAYGKGNALVLVNQANAAPQLATGGPQKEYIQVTLPAGVNAGDTIHVQAPDGRLNAIVVPAGLSAGSTFTVEFADGPPPPVSAPVAASAATNIGVNHAQSSAPPEATPVAEDDGFASGFGNYRPHSHALHNPHDPYSTIPAEPDINIGSSYPSAPAYPSSKY